MLNEMLNANFNYKGNLVVIQCEKEDKLLNVCSKFASKINEPVDSKIYIWNNQLLNLDKSIYEQMHDSLEKNEEINIIVNDIAKNDTVLIKYNFNGVDEEFKAKKEDNIFELIQALIKKPIDILFGGKRATQSDFQKNFNQLANSIDKQKNQMNLLVIERETLKSENGEQKTEEEKKDYDKEEEKEENKLKNDEEKENKEDNNFSASFEKYLEIYRELQKIKNYFKRLKMYLFKFLLFLLIEFLLIGSFIFLACFFKFNDLLYENKTIALGVFIPSLISLFVLYFFKYIYFEKIDNNKIKLCIIFISLYIILISLLLIMLSRYIPYEYILSTLSLNILDLIVYIISNFISPTHKAVISFFVSLVAKTGGLLFLNYYLFDPITPTTIVLIGVVSLIISGSITLYKLDAMDEFEETHYLFFVVKFDFSFIAPIIVIICIILMLILYIVFIIVIYILAFFRHIIQILFREDI